MLDDLRRRLRARGPWPRRALAAACLVLAALTALSHAPAADHGATVPVVVASKALTAGHRVVAGEVTVRRFTAAQVPGGSARSPTAVVGRRLAGAVTAGEPLTSARLIGRGLTAGLPTGWVALSIDVADPHVADFVRAGDVVDIVATADPSGDAQPRATPLGRGVRVLAVLAAGAGEGSTEVVVAAGRPTAMQLAARRGLEPFALFAGKP